MDRGTRVHRGENKMKYTLKERKQIANAIDKYDLNANDRGLLLYLAKQAMVRYEKFNLSATVDDFIEVINAEVMKGHHFAKDMRMTGTEFAKTLKD